MQINAVYPILNGINYGMSCNDRELMLNDAS